MRTLDRVHDRAMLDALEDLGGKPFAGEVWRVTRKGRAATVGSTANGRWGPQGEFEVLYTAVERNGALAEIGYRRSLEPIWPSRIDDEVHKLRLNLVNTLQFENVDELAHLGVDANRYESFDYSATQAIAAAAHFLEYDGMVVPSARFPCQNVVVFLDQLKNEDQLDALNTEDVDWEEWRQHDSGYPRGFRAG